MTVGNVISLTPPRPGLPGFSPSFYAKSHGLKSQASRVSAKDSSSSDCSSSDDPEEGARSCSRATSRAKMASGSGTSLWKPVFLTIACLNILAVGGLLYSAPWTHKAEEAELQANLEKQAIARKLLLPEKVTAKQFLANAPAALRKKLLKELEDDAIRSALKGVESDEVAGAKDDADDDSKSASEADHGKVASS